MKVYLLCGESYRAFAHFDLRSVIHIDHKFVQNTGNDIRSQIHLMRKFIRKSKHYENVVINATGLSIKERNQLLRPYRGLQRCNALEIIGVATDDNLKFYPRYKEMLDSIIDVKAQELQLLGAVA
ncbi:hypothetical protein [Vibrio owensii]|uniref:hypothetical protein n=1 Tax=Vibrio owensii TaxID=696485 RepID=UPI004068387E